MRRKDISAPTHFSEAPGWKRRLGAGRAAGARNSAADPSPRSGDRTPARAGPGARDKRKARASTSRGAGGGRGVSERALPVPPSARALAGTWPPPWPVLPTYRG